MVILKNENVTVKIDELGAELRSMAKNGVEYIWNGDPNVWDGTAPIMFPICGGLKEDKFSYEGKEYTLTKHGFAKYKTFSVEEKSETKATFLHISDEETLKAYPFLYEFRVVFELKGDALDITYKVNNKTDGKMYFSIGSHEAYATPEGIEDYDIIFPEKETLQALTLAGNFVGEPNFLVCKDTDVLPLYDKYFLIDALVFDCLKSRKTTLRNRKTGRSISVSFPNAEFYLLWHKHGGGYICMEPWEGIPDSLWEDGDITKKRGIRELDKGAEYSTTHTIAIEG